MIEWEMKAPSVHILEQQQLFFCFTRLKNLELKALAIDAYLSIYLSLSWKDTEKRTHDKPLFFFSASFFLFNTNRHHRYRQGKNNKREEVDSSLINRLSSLLFFFFFFC